MDIQTVQECTRLSEEEKITFPEVVKRLAMAGIESYTANLLVPNKIYYSGNEKQEVSFEIKTEKRVAFTFHREGILHALRAIQSQKIGYQEFLKRIMDAGVLFYLVFINGRKAIYFGRNGEEFVEEFPPQALED